MKSYRIEYLGLLGRIAIAVIAIILSVSQTGCPVSTPTPTIHLQPPNPGTCPNTVTLTDSNGAAAIYYTTDGTQPNTSVGGSTKQFSPNGTGPFQVNVPQGNAPNAIVSAVAIAPGLQVSPTATQAFSCPAVQLPPAPTFSPAPGTFNCPFNVTISDTNAAAQLLLNLSATAPTLNQFDYLGSFKSVSVSSNTTFSAYAVVFGSNPPATILFSQPPPSQAAYTCTQPPPPATFDTIDIQIQTGNDNADQNLEITAILNGTTTTGFQDTLCLKPSNDSSLPQGPAGIMEWGNCANGSSSAPSWGNGVVVAFPPVKLLHPLTPQQLAATTMRIRAHQSGCSLSCSNWDIQAIKVIFSDSTGNLSPTTLSVGTIVGSGWNDSNCIARLKAPSNATTISFGLGNPSQGTPPPPILYLTYSDGNEAGQHATCQDNGDGGPVP